MTKPFYLERVVAMNMLGIISTSELPKMATNAISNGCNDYSVIQLSKCDPRDLKKINLLFNEIKSKHKKEAMTMLQALKFYAKEISKLIISGEISPQEGANMLWRAQISSELDEFHDLDGFIYAASEMDDRPEDEAIFKSGILKEAQRVIDTY